MHSRNHPTIKIMETSDSILLTRTVIHAMIGGAPQIWAPHVMLLSRDQENPQELVSSIIMQGIKW